MIKLTVAMVDSGLPSYLNTLTSPLPAVYVLAVHILRERRSLLVRADFEVCPFLLVLFYYQANCAAHESWNRGD